MQSTLFMEMNKELSFNNKSRIRVLAVIGGVFITLATLFFFMSLGAALGFWSYRMDESMLEDTKFWALAAATWSLSVLVGTLFTVVAAGTTTYKDALINSLTTWAASYLLFGGVAVSIADTTSSSVFGPLLSASLFWNGFAGDASALILTIVGSYFGVLIERRSFSKVSLSFTGAASQPAK
ncbi:MAG: hypothetical protein ACAH59_09850 [Pseudobdellovibrionaceae bacterium]